MEKGAGKKSDREALMENLEENAIPENIVSMTIDDYDEFLTERRKLMAQLMERFYKRL